MGRITVTVEWVLVYLVGSLIMGGLLIAAVGDESHRPKWIDATLFLVFFVGLGLILWQGVAGHLPGTGVSARGVFPFIARFIAWSGGLGLLVGGVCALIGYFCITDWSNRDAALGMMILPGTFGCLVGLFAGAVVAIVKAFR
jgi:hypothetical protein